MALPVRRSMTPMIERKLMTRRLFVFDFLGISLFSTITHPKKFLNRYYSIFVMIKIYILETFSVFRFVNILKLHKYEI